MLGRKVRVPFGRGDKLRDAYVFAVRDKLSNEVKRLKYIASTMRVICPGDAISAGKLVQNAIDLEGPVYVRLGRSKIPVIYGDEDTFEIGKAKVLKKGKDITFIATGIMVNEMLKADEELEKLGVSCTLIDMHTIKPLDIDTILNESENTKGIVTCEEHSIIGGLFSAVSESLAPYGNKKIRAVAQMDTYGESGKPDLLREKYGLIYLLCRQRNFFKIRNF